jgi:hypothetical protein
LKIDAIPPDEFKKEKEDDRDVRKPNSSDFQDQLIIQKVHEEQLNQNEDLDDVVQMEIETDFENNI